MNDNDDYEIETPEETSARWNAMDHTPPTAHIIAIKQRDEWRYLVVFDDPKDDDIEIPPGDDQDWSWPTHRSVKSLSLIRPLTRSLLIETHTLERAHEIASLMTYRLPIEVGPPEAFCVPRFVRAAQERLAELRRQLEHSTPNQLGFSFTNNAENLMRCEYRCWIAEEMRRDGLMV
jgi:hypothetical protein